MNEKSRALALVPPPPSGPERWSIRGVGKPARDLATKGAELSGVPIGAWVTDAINEKFARDLAKSKMPAVITEQRAPLVIADAECADLTDHLEVLDKVFRFADDLMSFEVRSMANKVIIDRLRKLRTAQPRQTKQPKSQT